MILEHENRQRFDLLLLGEEEYYLSDESVVLNIPRGFNTPPDQKKGRMKICSRSLFFDPQDMQFPITKFDFQWVERIEPAGNESFIIFSKKIVEARQNNQAEPYKFQSGNFQHVFSLNYVSLSDFLQKVERLFKISKLPRHIAQSQVNTVIKEMELGYQFDLSWLEYLDEKPLIEHHCIKVSPLVNNPGRLMITNRIVYFQALNNIDAQPVIKYSFNEITRVIKRRHSLRHLGLELILENTDAGSFNRSAFFAFMDEETTNAVYQLLASQPGMTKLQHENQSQMTFNWQCGLLSNFDYLMYLNSLADRTFNDLTQYPVFPWILNDYDSEELDLTDVNIYRDLTKPMGALDPSRLSFFRQRYEQMDDPKFLYGTHYSTPAYVLYFLVRVAPHHMLRLQNGQFDDANRLFGSVRGSWFSCSSSNTGDLKELIPEFFTGSGSFLLNSENLKLGRRQDRTWVGDVELPNWASSPEDFIAKHRQALESDYVSDNLHHWIDLIFGYKQQGKEANQANNVFHPWTYEGAVDLQRVKDPIEREAIQVQINEFGQTPKLLFDRPHPARFTLEERSKRTMFSSLVHADSHSSLSSANNNSFAIGSNAATMPASLSASNSTSSLASSQSSKGVRPFGSAGSGMQSSAGASNTSGSFLISATTSGQSGSSPNLSLPTSPSGKNLSGSYNALGGNASLSNTAGSSVNLSSPNLSRSNSIGQGVVNELAGQFGELDLNQPMVATFESQRSKLTQLKVTNTISQHRDKISGLKMNAAGSIVFSVSSDGSLKVYDLQKSRQIRSIKISQLALSSCALTADEKNVLIGSWDNHVYIYNVDYSRVTDTVYAHDDAVSSLQYIDNTLVTGSWDTTTKVWKCRPSSIDKNPLVEFHGHESEVKCIDLEKSSCNIVASGSEDGVIFLNDIRMSKPIRSIHAHVDEVCGLKLLGDGRLISIGKDHSFKINNMSGQELFQIVLSEYYTSMTAWNDFVFLGGEGGALRLWNLMTSQEICKHYKPDKVGISCVHVQADGSQIVTGDESGGIAFWS